MVRLLFDAVRMMVGIGVAAAALMALSLLRWWRGGLNAASFSQWPWFSWAWILSAPAGYLAIESGWVVRCVGRQPWTVYGQLRTADAASVLPAGEVLTSLTTFAVLYTALLIFALYFGSRIIAKGPNLSLEPPHGSAEGPESRAGTPILSDSTPSA